MRTRVLPRFLAFTAWLACLPTPVAQESFATGVLASEVRHLGWIVYGARSTAGDWDLFACRPDASEHRPLTWTPDFSEFAPQVSRDGRRLLYRRLPRVETIDGNRYGAQGELVLANADGTGVRVLGPAGAWPWASFSPDATQVATLSVKGFGFVDLERLEVLRTLPRQGFFQQPTWSPDGRWLVGVANSYGTGWSVARLDLLTGEARAVNRGNSCTPDWFPDSRRVIFSWRPPGQTGNDGQGWTQLWQTTIAGDSRQLVFGEDGRHVYGGHVSPDGRYVLFTGNVEEDGDPGRAGAPMGLLRLSDAPILGGDSGELRGLYPHANRGPVLTLPAGWEPCWTPHDIFDQSRAPAGEPSPAGSSSPATLAAELRGRGTLVCSAKTAAGDWDLFLLRPDGSGRHPITRTAEYHEAGARFSPDGTRLLYYRLPRSEAVDNNTYGTFELVVAQADGSAPVVWGRDYPWASWGPDGRQLACLTPQGICLIELTHRAVVREFPRRGIVGQLVWSPDGRHLAGTANGLGSFWNIGCLDLATGAIRAVSETERYNCTPDWSPDGQRIVYARGIIPEQPGHAELWAADTQGASRQRLHAEPGHHLYGACVSPDGQYLLFTRSAEDLGKVPDITMAIIRWPAADAPDSSPATRLDLGQGWEPHWTATEILK
ncbi:MAG: PD40 domain-containing protein [Verrucomicrobiales bacterium]|nr:PD40 domain-containing protein [Verrucomicrobiales bacterium]